jgi:predicted O-methyltransferase YrrM
MENIIDDESVVMEHGAGGSTLWFAERVDYLLSFETSPRWYGDIGNALYDSGHLYHADTNVFGNSTLIFASEIEDRGVKLPRNSPKEYDLIFIDGRGRIKFWNSVRKYVKPGGWVVWDDANRRKYWHEDGLASIDMVAVEDWIWEHEEKGLAPVPPELREFWPVYAFRKESKRTDYTLFARKPYG